MLALRTIAADQRARHDEGRAAIARQKLVGEQAKRAEVTRWRRTAWERISPAIEEATGRHLFPGRFDYFEGTYNNAPYTEASCEFEGAIEFTMRVYHRGYRGGEQPHLEVRPIPDQVDAPNFVKLPPGERRGRLGRLLIDWGIA